MAGNSTGLAVSSNSCGVGFDGSVFFSLYFAASTELGVVPAIRVILRLCKKIPRQAMSITPTTPTPTPMPALALVLRLEAEFDEEEGEAIVVEALTLAVEVDVDVVTVPVAVHCGSGYVVLSPVFRSIIFRLTSGEYAVSVDDSPETKAMSSTKRHVLLTGGGGLQLATQKRLEPLPELAVELKVQTRVQGGAVPLGPWLHSR